MRFGAWFIVLLAACCHGAELTWSSAATGGDVVGHVTTPAARETPLATVIYLRNLSTPRFGREADEPILTDLVAGGHLVLVLDYAHHPRAISPLLNADVLKLRRDISRRLLLADFPVDVNHVFIIAEGFRLKRDVEFARDGDRVLGMDIIYPSQPAAPVPLLMEITCDNEHRMGNSSLVFCHDTLLEGGQFAGFAVAMVDHPVPPPYKGLDDPMPQCIERMRSAVGTLHSLNGELNLNGNIGAIGFSRGGPFAAILAAQGDVQAAMVHGNRYDYLNLRGDDPMLARFEKAWGPLETNRDKWAMHGASEYLANDASPMFLNTSNTESAEYRDGLEQFHKLLIERGIEHIYQVDNDGRGHRVSTDPKTLSAVYRFFGKYPGR